MPFCPKTFKPCIDDLCGAGGCFLLGGMPTLEQCSNCGELFSRDGEVDCGCEPDCFEDDPLEE